MDEQKNPSGPDQPGQPQPGAGQAPGQQPSAGQQPGVGQPASPVQPQAPDGGFAGNPYAAQQPVQPAAPYGQPYGQQPAAPYQPPYQQPAPPYGQPQATAPYPPYGAQPYGAPVQPLPGNGKAIGALVCGILAILFSTTVIFGIVLGIVAVVLGVQAKKAGSDGKATGGKVCGIVGIVFSLLIMAGAVVFSVSLYNYAQDNPGSSTGSISSSSHGSAAYDDVLHGDEAQAVYDAGARKLDALVNMSDADLKTLADKMDESFAASGSHMADFGIDPLEVARWATSDMSYTIDSAYSFNDGTGALEATVTMHDVYGASNAFYADMQEFLSSSEYEGMTSQQEVYARIGQLYREAMEKTPAMTEEWLYVDAVKTNGTWAMDQENWDEKVGYLFLL